ncbi:hypothetical protein D3C83_157420 [compost metagenome]
MFKDGLTTLGNMSITSDESIAIGAQTLDSGSNDMFLTVDSKTTEGLLGSGLMTNAFATITIDRPTSSSAV